VSNFKGIRKYCESVMDPVKEVVSFENEVEGNEMKREVIQSKTLWQCCGTDRLDSNTIHCIKCNVAYHVVCVRVEDYPRVKTQQAEGFTTELDSWTCGECVRAMTPKSDEPSLKDLSVLLLQISGQQQQLRNEHQAMKDELS